MPRMSWKREVLLDEETALGPALQANPLRNGNHEAGEAPIITMNGAPLRNIFRHPVTNLSGKAVFSSETLLLSNQIIVKRLVSCIRLNKDRLQSFIQLF